MMANDRGDETIAARRGLTVGQVARLRATRGMTTEVLNALPESALRRAVRRLDYPDQPRARHAFRAMRARNERGVIPPHALVAAIKELDSMRARTAAAPRIAGVPTAPQVSPRALVPPTAGLNPAHTGWEALGPGNIGGRTRAIVIHPTNRNTIWAGSVGGGVWHTADGGASWMPVDDLMANLAVSCIAMDPSNPRIIYAGTGEGFTNLDALQGGGIFRTVDGVSWTPLAATTGPEFQAVNRLAVSSDGTVVLAATPSGIFRSADPDRLTWTQTLDARMADVKFHPTSSGAAVAGGLDNGDAFVTADGGATWTPATHDTRWGGRVELCYARHDPTVVYASVQMQTGEIWRSSDGGNSYSRRGNLLADGKPATFLGDQGWYGNVIWAGDPGTADLVIVGGVDLWQSTDGGDTLRDISSWWDPRSAHADQHCIVARPDYDGVAEKTVYFGNDGGIFMTTDLATVGSDAAVPRVTGWVKLDNTYGVTQFFAGAGNAATGTIIGGAQDNGTIRYTPAAGNQGGPQRWTEMFGGDGGCCAADSTDPSHFYGEYVFANIVRSSDGGASSEYISGQFWNGSDWDWKPVPFRITDAKNQNALFIAPFVLDPNEPNRLLVGGLSLWRTNDARTANTDSTGPSWTPIKPGVGRPISAVAVAAGDADLIWIGHDDGQVYQTANGTSATPVWQRIDQVGAQPLAISRHCTCIVIDPRDHATAYALFGGYSAGNVWKTADGGATWNSLGAALPAAPAYSLAIHPNRSDHLYLGTEVGLFASEDTGATWSPTNEGPTNCSVDGLFWMNTTLICATHGRGMFRINVP